MYYSQAGQDAWVLSRIAKGYYVDVGAHDGIESSNTLALEQAGWEGVCIEPSPAFQLLRKNRSAICVNTAVHYYNGFTEFSGMSLDPAGERIECKQLKRILDESYAPKTIDYLSIDVEGAEMFVLRGMDFKQYHVRMITIEHNAYQDGPGRQAMIYHYLTEKGFTRTHKDVKCLTPPYEGLIYEDWYENNQDLFVSTGAGMQTNIAVVLYIVALVKNFEINENPPYIPPQ